MIAYDRETDVLATPARWQRPFDELERGPRHRTCERAATDTAHGVWSRFLATPVTWVVVTTDEGPNTRLQFVRPSDLSAADAFVGGTYGRGRDAFSACVQTITTFVNEVFPPDLSLDALIGAAVSRRDTGGRIDAGRDKHVGLQAVADLRDWLGLRVDDIAAMSGISPSTVYYWADHPESVPRAAKVAPLMRLRGVVGAVFGALGESDANRWLLAGTSPRLEHLRDQPAALDALEDEVYERLLSRAHEQLHAVGPPRENVEDAARKSADLSMADAAGVDPIRAAMLDPERVKAGDEAPE